MKKKDLLLFLSLRTIIYVQASISMQLPFGVLSVDFKAERDEEPIVNKILKNNKICTQELNEWIEAIFKLKVDLWNIINRDFNIYASEAKMTLADA